jgi:hypothetical protein
MARALNPFLRALLLRSYHFIKTSHPNIIVLRVGISLYGQVEVLTSDNYEGVEVLEKI